MDACRFCFDGGCAYVGFTQKRKTPIKSSLSGHVYVFICMPFNKIL